MNITTQTCLLHNGMRIVTHAYPRSKTVHLGLLFNVGSRNEQPDQFGIAHLCEHLMFCGTKNIPDFDAHMTPYGASNNAWTSMDATCYLSNGPKDVLPLLLSMEVDRMQHIATDLKTENIAIEMDVVRNEIREQYELSPYGDLFLQQNSALFGANHPYGHPIIGSHDSLQSITVAQIRSFIQQWYAPNNATLLISGDIQPQKALDMAQKAFARLSSSSTQVKNTPPVWSAQPQIEKLHVRDQASYHFLSVEWIVPPRGNPLLQPLALLVDMLCAPRYGKLYQLLEITDKCATGVEGSLHPQMWSSQLSISAIPNTASDIQTVSDAIFAELEQIANGHVSNISLQQCKKRQKLGWLLSLEDLNCREELMLSWLQNHTSFSGFVEHFQRAEHVTLPDIIQAAQWLLKNNPLLSIGTPLATPN